MGRLLPSLSLALALLAGCADGQHRAAIGDLPLHSGEVLHDCRIGYRTFGRLNEAGDNAVLVPTWLAGTSEDLAPYVVDGGLGVADDSFVILVDALGNGVSSSPSTAGGSPFPRVAIADMVESQRRLLEQLGVHRLRAVIGTSMGGMQALEWAVAHPDRVDAVVAIASSPALGSDERARWERQIEETRRRGHAGQIGRALAEGRLRDVAWLVRYPAADWVAQADALVGYDIAARFGGSLERAAEELPPLLVIISTSDPVIDGAPARQLARLADAELVVLDGRCGHEAPGCEKAAVARAVARFLAGLQRGSERGFTAPAVDQATLRTSDTERSSRPR